MTLLLVLVLWAGASVPLALFVGRAIAIADDHARADAVRHATTATRSTR